MYVYLGQGARVVERVAHRGVNEENYNNKDTQLIHAACAF